MRVCGAAFRPRRFVLYSARMDEQLLSPIQEALVAYLREKGIAEPDVVFERPAQREHGDISTNIALRYAKTLGVSPVALVEELATHLRGARIPAIASVAAVSPGFLNITLSPQALMGCVRRVFEECDTYGRHNTHAGEVWVVEHTSPNPNKAMHLGHLHNNLTGMSIANLLSFEGAKVVRDCVDNNRGIAIAKAMWGFLDLMKKETISPNDAGYWNQHRTEWSTPEERNLTPDRFITACYVHGSQAAEQDPKADAAIRAMVVSWEAGDTDTWKLWEHILGYSWAGINKTLARLGNHWDVVWHEHEHYQDGKQWVEQGLSKGVFQKLDDGAVITNLAAYDLPDTVILKKDGTSLYLTQDVALTAMKKHTYGANHLVWVIGPEQTLAMKQLFAVCEQLGIGTRSEFTHVPYGYVGLSDEDGRFTTMSSREGNVVLIDDVLDAIREKTAAQLKEPDDQRAEALAVAALKFAILKAAKDQQIAFSVERSVDVHGDSGVYVLYTYARIRSLLRKAAEAQIRPDIGEWTPTSVSGLAIARELSWFPEAVAESASDFSVHHIAQYVLALCGAFNRWYGEEQILGVEDSVARLALAEAVSIVLKNGLGVLGIEVLEEV